MPDCHTRKSSSFMMKETRDHHLLLYLQHRTTSKFLQIIFFDGVNDLDKNSKVSKLQYWNWHNWNYRTKSENDPIFSTLTILSKLYQNRKWILHSHRNPQTLRPPTPTHQSPPPYNSPRHYTPADAPTLNAASSASLSPSTSPSLGCWVYVDTWRLWRERNVHGMVLVFFV